MANSIKIHTFTQEIESMKENPYQCSKCEVVFQPKALLLYYFKILIGENPYDISMYERSLQQVSRFVSHLITHKLEKTEKITSSTTCESTANTEIDNNDGGCDKSDQKYYNSDQECENSDKDLANSESEDVNIEQICVNNDPKPKESNFWTEVHGKGQRSWSLGNYKCKECGESFPKKLTLYKHLKSCHGIRPFVCSLCNKSFNGNNLLALHHKKVHLGENPHLKCNTCNKAFWRHNHLRKHVRTHIRKEERERPHKCDVCEKTFCLKDELSHHKKIHFGIKSHQCTYCGKMFMQKGHLKIHLRIHTGEKPYICELCGRGFVTNQSLSFHLDTHNEDRTKSYQCDICSKFFYGANHLRIHKRIHSRGKPHECNHCGMTFTNNSSRIRHERKHSGEKPHRCNQCNKSFTRPTKCCIGFPSPREDEKSKDLIFLV